MVGMQVVEGRVEDRMAGRVKAAESRCRDRWQARHEERVLPQTPATSCNGRGEDSASRASSNVRRALRQKTRTGNRQFSNRHAGVNGVAAVYKMSAMAQCPAACCHEEMRGAAGSRAG